MRYPASEKLEIIRLVEESSLPVRRTLEKIGIHGVRATGRISLSRCQPNRVQATIASFPSG
jgi:hypothetical protein